MKRMRVGSILASLVVLAVAAGPAGAWPTTVRAVYDVNFNGFTVGTFEFVSQSEQQSYTLTGNAQLSLLLGAFTWIGETRAFGLMATPAPKPAAFAFEDLVRLIRDAIGARTRLVHGPPSLALALSRPLDRLAGGTLLTRDELEGLMESLLVSKGNPTGKRRFEDWLAASAPSLGARFGSDLSRPWS